MLREKKTIALDSDGTEWLYKGYRICTNPPHPLLSNKYYIINDDKEHDKEVVQLPFSTIIGIERVIDAIIKIREEGIIGSHAIWNELTRLGYPNLQKLNKYTYAK